MVVTVVDVAQYDTVSPAAAALIPVLCGLTGSLYTVASLWICELHLTIVAM